MITFTTCFDESFDPGGIALIKSIRKFYNKKDANIVAFVNERPFGAELIKMGSRMGVEFHQMNGVDMLKAKAYCSRFVLCEDKRDIVCHIDTDAFILSKLTPILVHLNESDTIVAFEDSCGEGMPFYEIVNRCRPRTEKGQRDNFLFNAGIMFYHNGEAIREMMKEFSHLVQDEYVWAVTRNDQNILRSLIARYVEDGKITFLKLPSRHWNPKGKEANSLRREGDRWFNEHDGKRQYIWHGAGGRKPWRDDVPESVKEAFKWVQM